jgi:regulator of protease activity HflC (stomatin/prohibitin superfamily)
MENLFYLIPIALILYFGLFVVNQQTTAIVERFGKFTSIRQSGLQFKIPLVDKISGRVSLKIQQLDVIVETKTKDDVFVQLKISVQFQILREKVYDAFYKLQNPHDQITAYIFDTVRAEVPKMKLDDVFEKKDDIAQAIQRELKESMLAYGYDIVKGLGYRHRSRRAGKRSNEPNQCGRKRKISRSI